MIALVLLETFAKRNVAVVSRTTKRTVMLSEEPAKERMQLTPTRVTARVASSRRATIDASIVSNILKLRNNK